MYKTIIGIDPGKSGAITHIKLDEKGNPIGNPNVVRMPDYDKMNDYIKSITDDIDRTICFIEKLNVRHDDMVGGKMFGIQKMMKGYNYLTAALSNNKIGFIEVHPSTWQSGLKLILPKEQRKKESKPERKMRYKDVAQSKFKATKCYLWNCDALLILHFGWEKVMFDKSYMMKNLPGVDYDLLF